MEFQAGATQPRSSNYTAACPKEQEPEIDIVVGSENKTRVAAAATADQSDPSDHAADVDMTRNNDDESHGQQSDNDSAASHSDVESLAQDVHRDLPSNSDAESHGRQCVNDNDSRNSDMEPLEPASADEETEHSDRQEESYQSV